MPQPETIEQIMTLRRLTRAIAEVLRGQMMEYVATLTPLLRAKTVLGDYIHGGGKEPARRADKAFKELQALYDTIGTAKPFNLPRELKPPIDVQGVSLEVTPVEYTHVAKAKGVERAITVRSPLAWVLTYSDFAPNRFRDLMAGKNRTTDEMQQYVLNYLAIHAVTTNQPNLLQMLDALHFPVTTIKSPEFGDLPLTCIGAAITTSRPSDDLILQSAEMSGMDAFEEVVNPQDIAALRNPQRDRLLDLVRVHAPDLASA